MNSYPGSVAPSHKVVGHNPADHIGGIASAIPQLVKEISKDTGAEVLYHSDPGHLVSELLHRHRERTLVPQASELSIPNTAQLHSNSHIHKQLS